MAKSFKQAPAQTESSKPTSEKDFFSLLDEEHANAPVATRSVKTDLTSSNNISNTDNTDGPLVSALSNVTHVTDSVPSGAEEIMKSAPEGNSDVDVRQTFIISEQYLERLKDYVHTRRSAGEYDYTQKQALQEALDKLFIDFNMVPRPAHIRLQEEKRKQKIRRGRVQ